MTSKSKKLLASALELSQKQRAALAASLLESLDDEEKEDPAEVEKAWAEEIQRRIKEIDEGRAVLIPWAKVREKLRARLHGKCNSIPSRRRKGSRGSPELVPSRRSTRS